MDNISTEDKYKKSNLVTYAIMLVISIVIKLVLFIIAH
jgi:hypothetical protein